MVSTEKGDARSFTGVAQQQVPPPQPDWFEDTEVVDPAEAVRHFQETGRRHALDVIRLLVADARDPSGRSRDPLRVLSGTAVAEGDVAHYLDGVVASLVTTANRFREVERTWASGGAAVLDVPFDQLEPEHLGTVADAADAVARELIGRLDAAEFAAVVDEYALHRVAPHLAPSEIPSVHASTRDLLVARISMLVAGQPAVVARLDDHRASLVHELLPGVQVPQTGRPAGGGPADLVQKRFAELANVVLATLAHPSRRFTPAGAPGVVTLALVSTPAKDLLALHAARPELVSTLPPAHAGLVRHLARAQTAPALTSGAARPRGPAPVAGGLDRRTTTTTGVPVPTKPARSTRA